MFDLALISFSMLGVKIREPPDKKSPSSSKKKEENGVDPVMRNRRNASYRKRPFEAVSFPVRYLDLISLSVEVLKLRLMLA